MVDGRSELLASQRARNIKPFYVMEAVRAAMDKEAGGERVLHLEVGEPSTSAPTGVLSAASAALDPTGSNGAVLGYTMPGGMPSLRNRIVEWYDRRYGLAVDPSQILVTPGASGSCIVAFLGLWDHGDRVAVIEPGYPCYRNDLAALGIETVAVEVDATTDFRPTAEQLDAALPLDGLVLASPSNPTGTVLDDATLGEIMAWAAANDVSVAVDEIYHGLTYEAPATSALGPARAAGADVVILNSFSKYWSMTGWRLGWLVVPESMVTPMTNVMANLLISAPTLSQIGGVAAFDCIEECDANVERYRRNRSVLLDGLPAAGIDRFAPPDGAFYIWADVGHLVGSSAIPDSMALCRAWLDDLNLAATPGVDFDPRRGGTSVRLSYAGSEADMPDAVDRLGTWIAARP